MYNICQVGIMKEFFIELLLKFLSDINDNSEFLLGAIIHRPDVPNCMHYNLVCYTHA